MPAPPGSVSVTPRRPADRESAALPSKPKPTRSLRWPGACCPPAPALLPCLGSQRLTRQPSWSLTLAAALADGGWSVIPKRELPEGDSQVRATATDGVGNDSETSEAHVFTVDMQRPGAPEVTAPGALVSTRSPLIGGKAEPSSSVTVALDGVKETTINADSEGLWRFVPDKPVSVGQHSISATVTDAAGNTGPPSADYSFTVQRSHYGLGCTSSPAHPVAWVVGVLLLALRRR